MNVYNSSDSEMHSHVEVRYTRSVYTKEIEKCYKSLLHPKRQKASY